MAHEKLNTKISTRAAAASVRQRPRMKGIKLNFMNQSQTQKNASRIYAHEILMSGFLSNTIFFLEIVVSLFPKLKINQSILTTLLIVTLEDFLIKFNLKKNTTCTSFKVYEKIFSSHYHHCLSFYTMGNACELFRDRNM